VTTHGRIGTDSNSPALGSSHLLEGRPQRSGIALGVSEGTQGSSVPKTGLRLIDVAPWPRLSSEIAAVSGMLSFLLAPMRHPNDWVRFAIRPQPASLSPPRHLMLFASPALLKLHAIDSSDPVGVIHEPNLPSALLVKYLEKLARGSEGILRSLALKRTRMERIE
jgi:hypothetical protein